MKRYQTFGHTADLGVFFYGSSPEQVFVNAGLSLPRLLLDRPPDRGEIKEDLDLEGIDREDLLIRWLSELLYIYNVRRLVLTDLNEPELGAGRWRASLALAPFDPDINGIKNDIKAATYHDVEFKPHRGGWRARVVFDL